jgi:hypothetical protein
MTTKLETGNEKASGYVQVAANGVLSMPRKMSSHTKSTPVVPHKVTIEKPDKGPVFYFKTNLQTYITLSNS